MNSEKVARELLNVARLVLGYIQAKKIEDPKGILRKMNQKLGLRLSLRDLPENWGFIRDINRPTDVHQSIDEEGTAIPGRMSSMTILLRGHFEDGVLLLDDAYIGRDVAQRNGLDSKQIHIK